MNEVEIALDTRDSGGMNGVSRSAGSGCSKATSWDPCLGINRTRSCFKEQIFEKDSLFRHGKTQLSQSERRFADFILNPLTGVG
jgi:hypothetical protein